MIDSLRTPTRCRGSRRMSGVLVALTSLFAGALGACVSEPDAGTENPELGSATGFLDPAFGDRGRVETTFEPSPSSTDQFHRLDVRRMALQNDGKLLVFSVRGKYMGFPLLARYEANGALDASFGTAGRIQPEQAEEQFSDFVLRPDGTIVLITGLAGSVRMTRLLSDGAIDPTYGDASPHRTFSLCHTPLRPGASCETAYQKHVELLPDGKFLMLVSAFSSTATALTRFDDKGHVDATFGDQGVVPLAVAPSSQSSFGSLLVQRDGKILALEGGLSTKRVLERRNPDGSLDTTFGSGGRVTVPTVNMSPGQGDPYGVINSIVEAPDGSLVLVGVADDSTHWNVRKYVGERAIQVVRLTAAGASDPTFGTNGAVLLRAIYDHGTQRFAASSVDPSSYSSDFMGMDTNYPVRRGVRALFDAQNRLVVANDVKPDISKNRADARDLVLYRLLPDGALDPAFGKAGLAQTSFRGADYLGDAVLRPNGRLVVGVAATLSWGVDEESVYEHDYTQNIALGQFKLP